MKSATITIPNDLEADLNEVARKRNLSHAEVIEDTLRKYLNELPQERPIADDDDFRPFRVPVLPDKDEFGEPDVSVNHDYYLAKDLEHKLGRA
ncbi:MAG: CopG family transcriptional regulator [Thermomicrobiales bacterium]